MTVKTARKFAWFCAILGLAASSISVVVSFAHPMLTAQDTAAAITTSVIGFMAGTAAIALEFL